MPYDIEQGLSGLWNVIDVTTGEVVKLNGSFMEGLELDDADDLADILNHIEAERPPKEKEN
jgi:hypothetical protein